MGKLTLRNNKGVENKKIIINILTVCTECKNDKCDIKKILSYNEIFFVFPTQRSFMSTLACALH